MFKIFQYNKTIFILLLTSVFPLLAADATMDVPILRINTDMHTDAITSIDIDADERYLVTGSKDKTVRVWTLPTEWDKENLAGARLERILRPPINDNSDEGQINAVAISPDGKEIIAGGWAGCDKDMDMGCSIYIFERATGKLAKRISRLPAEVLHLAYSSKGEVFLATLGTKDKSEKGEGVRIYRTSDYGMQKALKGDYKGASHWAEIFYDPNDPKASRTVTTCEDGLVRLYDKDFHFIAKYKVDENKENKVNNKDKKVYPYMARFHPSGNKIAVGLKNATKILLLSAKSSGSLNRQKVNKDDKASEEEAEQNSSSEKQSSNNQDEQPNLTRRDTLSLQSDGQKGDLSMLTWSKDGEWLYAAGYHYRVDGVRPILRWYQGSSQSGYLVWPSIDNITDLRALKNGSIVFGAENPAFGAFDSRGQKMLHHDAEIANFKQNRYDNTLRTTHSQSVDFQSNVELQLAVDASTVQFGYSDQQGKHLARFSIDNRTLSNFSAAFDEDEKLTEPLVSGMNFSKTGNKKCTEKNNEKKLDIICLSELRLRDNVLDAKSEEIVYTLAIASNRQRFLLGTNKFLRLFDKNGNQQWEKDITTAVLQVNIAKNDKIAVAALEDGTLKWYRLADGEELLSFFPHQDAKRWILWTPLGYYDASVGGEELVGWHVNLGPNKAADFFSAAQFRKRYYRPDVVTQVLKRLDVEEALFVANQEANMKIVTPEIRKVLKKEYPAEVVNTVLKMFNIDKTLHLLAQEMGYLSEEQVEKKPVRELLPPVIAQLKKCPAKKANAQSANRDTEAMSRGDSVPFSNTDIELCYRIRRPSDEEIIALKVLVNGRPLGEIRRESRTRNPYLDSSTTKDINECTSLPKNFSIDDNPEASLNVEDNPEASLNTENSSTDDNLEASLNMNNQVITHSYLDCELPQDQEEEHLLNITDLPTEDVEVSLIAENRFAASDPVSLNLQWTGETPRETTKPNLYGLAVGISQYNDKTIRLKYAARDATDFFDAFKKQKGNHLYDKVEIKWLPNATKAQVLNGLKWIRKTATINDVAVLFFAGHGYNDSDGEYYFLPRDVDQHNIRQTGIIYQQIKSNITALRSKTLFFLDTCHSGNVMGSGVIGRPVNVDRVSNDLASSENGIVVFAAATGNQLAWEDDSWGNGAFTKALLEGLEGEADFINDGQIKFSELNTYLSDRVSKLTDGQQTPTTAIPKTIADFPVALTPWAMDDDSDKSSHQRKKPSTSGGSRGLNKSKGSSGVTVDY
ncbi:caspase family protein [Candidatus Parabeggiatoa sp. HSG14]|uniref:caspase family protein n=1 Tax=Candidatus Parabeggiatoa sp. HSG14 TaxID=3055593 RepID=UPI0025A7871C|nr:caspase family protein [Thiotrichales bacterium HSG14]